MIVFWNLNKCNIYVVVIRFMYLFDILICNVCCNLFVPPQSPYYNCLMWFAIRTSQLILHPHLSWPVPVKEKKKKKKETYPNLSCTNLFVDNLFICDLFVFSLIDDFTLFVIFVVLWIICCYLIVLTIHSCLLSTILN
jgi:hypothetical protein